ncbi:MAG: hypothetical protein AAFW82_10245 [Pseudomonadota bacterium]
MAQYCSDAENANDPVCQLNVEIDGQKTALADTDLRLTEARSIANSALTQANQATALAQRALSQSEDAQAAATSALLRESDLACETRVIQKTDTGTCRPGYTLMSCTQTRYTTRAGGLSFIREIDDEKCRFNSRVLEMHARCCTTQENARRLGELSGGY